MRRSGCPVGISLDLIGDRWSLLVVRDLMVRGFTTFKQFQASGEGIASNILADRLRRLEASGIITAETPETDGRRVHYRLTEKGIDLAPVLLELLLWGARHEDAGLPRELLEHIDQHRGEFLAEARRRWRDRDLTPLISPPTNQEGKNERPTVSQLRRPLRRGPRVLQKRARR